jgi:hypothetical protein
MSMGKLTIVSSGTRTSDGRNTWVCRCDCGFISTVRNGHLRAGSSGCRNCSRVTHGESRRGERSPEYRAWTHLKNRCDNPKNKKYHRYGKRGIMVCKRWQVFENFLADMGRKPLPHLSVERINNDGNYEPENCKWGTPTEQARNSSTSMQMDYMGKTRALSEIVELSGTDLGYHTVKWRLYRGWTLHQSLTLPKFSKVTP